MTLVDDLKGGFSSGGFDLGATFAGAGGLLGAISVTPGILDLGTLQSAARSIGGTDVSGIADAVAGAVSQVLAFIDGRPSAEDMFGPLTQKLAALERLATIDLAAAAASFRVPAGVDRFAGAVQALPAVGGGALEIIGGLLPAVRVAGPLAQTAELVAPFLDLVATVQRLAALAADSITAAQLASGLQGLVAAAGFDALGADIVARAGALAAFAVGLHAATDDAIVDLILAEADSVTAALAGAAALPGAWLDIALAAVERADIPSLTARVDAGCAALRTVDFGLIADLAAAVRGWLAPLMTMNVGVGPPNVGAFLTGLATRIGPLTQQIDGLDLGPAVEAVVTSALGDVLAPLRAIEEAAHQVVATVESALAGVRAAIGSVDLAPVLDSIRDVVEPIADALVALNAGIAGAGAVLQKVAADVSAASDQVEAAMGSAATAVGEAFGAVRDQLRAIDLPALLESVRGAVVAMADALAAAPIAPVFNTATAAIDAAAAVVEAVPLDLLPDDTRQELQAKVAPIKAIKFEAEVTTPLKAEMDAIVDQLDTAVLDELRAAYAKVLELLEDIDPAPAIATLQRDAFDPLLERLRSVDLARLLEPVVQAVDEAKQAIAGLDLDGVLSALDDAVGDVADAVAALDPATLIEPLAARLDDVLGGVAITAVRNVLAKVTTEIDRAVELAAGPLKAVDRAMLTRLVDSLIDVLLEAATAATPSARTVHALVRLVGGASEVVDSLAEAADWVAGRADPVLVLSKRLTTAADGLEAVAQAVGALTLASALAAMGPPHTALVAAVAGLPAGGRLRIGLEPLVARVNPAVLLAFGDQRDRAVADIHDAAELLRVLAGAGRSELQVVAGELQDALAPIRQVTAQLRVLVGRFGAAPLDDPVVAVLMLLEAVKASTVFDPLADAILRLLHRFPAGIKTALVAPVKEVAAEVERLLSEFDIRFVTDELAAVQAAVVAQIETIRPSVALAGLLGPAQDAIDALVELDVLEPVRAVVKEVADILTALEAFSPTTLLAPVVDIYNDVVAAASGLDVDRLAGPVIDALQAIDAELDDGLDQAAAAVKRLQEALP